MWQHFKQPLSPSRPLLVILATDWIRSSISRTGKDPAQSQWDGWWDNILAAAASRVVVAWPPTGVTGRAARRVNAPSLERSDVFSDAECDALYSGAEKLFNTKSTSFDISIRRQLVNDVLGKA